VVVGAKTEALGAFLGSKTTTVAGGLGGSIGSIGGFAQRVRVRVRLHSIRRV
jgi:hypothetical protein